MPPPGVTVPHQSPHLVTTADLGSNSFLFVPPFLVPLLPAGRGFTLVVLPFLSPSPSSQSASHSCVPEPLGKPATPDTWFRQLRLHFSALACLLSQPEPTAAPGSRTPCSVPRAPGAPGVQLSGPPPVPSARQVPERAPLVVAAPRCLRAHVLVQSGIRVTSVSVGPEAAVWSAEQPGARPVPSSSLHLSSLRVCVCVGGARRAPCLVRCSEVYLASQSARTQAGRLGFGPSAVGLWRPRRVWCPPLSGGQSPSLKQPPAKPHTPAGPADTKAPATSV